MYYEVEFKPKALKDCNKIPKKDVRRIFEKIEMMQHNLEGDVKKLTNFTPEYRLRAGSYRVLFEIEYDIIVIYRILHRQKAYT